MFTKRELGLYWKGFRNHLAAWIGGAAMTLASLFTSLPSWLIWPWLVIGLLITGYFVWRDESRKLEKSTTAIEREKVLQETSEAMRNGVVPFAAFLSAGAIKLASDEDVLWVCDQLTARGRKSPLSCLKMTVNPLEGANLKEFLRDASLSAVGFEKELHFFSFAHRWATDRGWIPPQYKPQKASENEEKQTPESSQK